MGSCARHTTAAAHTTNIAMATSIAAYPTAPMGANTMLAGSTRAATTMIRSNSGIAPTDDSEPARRPGGAVLLTMWWFLAIGRAER